MTASGDSFESELDAARVAVVEVAKAAVAHGFVRNLAEGRDTRVGERGGKALGRSAPLHRHPPDGVAGPEKLLLDEAASAVGTGYRIQRPLDGFDPR